MFFVWLANMAREQMPQKVQGFSEITSVSSLFLMSNYKLSTFATWLKKSR